MEDNPSYGAYTAYPNTDFEDPYELVDIQPTIGKEELTYESPVPAAAPVQNQARDVPRKSLTCCLCVVSIVAVLALVLALVAVLLAVSTFTNNPSQQIQALQSQLLHSDQQIQFLQSQVTNSDQDIQSQLMNSSQEIQTLQQEVRSLRMLLNQTQMSLLTTEVNLLEADDILRTEVEGLRDSLSETLPPGGASFNPVSSCTDIPHGSPSGEYWIQTNSSSSPVLVYCDTNQRNCSCNTTGPWMRVANLDMTNSSQQCPCGFRLVSRTTAPLRTCGRPEPPFVGCLSTTYPTHGVEYSRVCGRVIGYHLGFLEAFAPYISNTSLTIDSLYVDGVSLTYGQSPRQHIWTFASALTEINPNMRFSCPCIEPEQPFTDPLPPYVGQDYFCDTGTRNASDVTFYADDPLWDGQGCGGNSTCCSFNNPPWFCKQLPQPTTDDIELRLCGSIGINDEDIPLERVEIHVQ